MRSLTNILATATDPKYYREQFEAAAKSLGCDVSRVRRCGSDHRGEPGYAGQPMSGVHYHAVSA